MPSEDLARAGKLPDHAMEKWLLVLLYCVGAWLGVPTVLFVACCVCEIVTRRPSPALEGN